MANEAVVLAAAAAIEVEVILIGLVFCCLVWLLVFCLFVCLFCFVLVFWWFFFFWGGGGLLLFVGGGGLHVDLLFCRCSCCYTRNNDYGNDLEVMRCSCSNSCSSNDGDDDDADDDDDGHVHRQQL